MILIIFKRIFHFVLNHLDKKGLDLSAVVGAKLILKGDPNKKTNGEYYLNFCRKILRLSPYIQSEFLITYTF